METTCSVVLAGILHPYSERDFSRLLHFCSVLVLGMTSVLCA